MKERLLRIAEVRQQTGLSKASVYALADFPKPLKISTRASAWREVEIQSWIKSRIGARADSQPRKP